MRKIKTIKHNKIWGYELWLYSPLKGMETTFEENNKKNVGGPLIKIIKSEKPLSIQVHPDDEMAKKIENMNNGKSESWVVLDCDENAEMIVGLKNYSPSKIKGMLEDKTFENNLKTIKSKKGLFINVPAGLVHGIGANNLIFEVQQPSDVTYRFFDYNRLQDGKPRELHVEKSLQAMKDLDYKLIPSSLKPLTYINKVTTQIFYEKEIITPFKCILIDLENFETYVGEKGERYKGKGQIAVVKF